MIYFMFEYKYKFNDNALNTTYGSVCITNVVFDTEELENALPEIIFDDNNIKHMFAVSELDDKTKCRIYRRFIPKSNTADLCQFIEENLAYNKSFYSFLAEGLLGLIYRDLYSFKLAKGIIDLNETLIDSHTGVDACMYNLEENTIVLGEAKFYNDFNSGMKKIINDFTEGNIKNKLISLQTIAENCDDTERIIIKNLSCGDYEELTIDRFMNQRITFAGFVLHSENNICKYKSKDFYKKYYISSNCIFKNIKESLHNNDINGEYNIILIHLPIHNKKSLILKVIETARNKLSCLGDVL